MRWEAWSPHHSLDLNEQGRHIGTRVQQNLHELGVRQDTDAQISEGAAGALGQLLQGSSQAQDIQVPEGCCTNIKNKSFLHNRTNVSSCVVTILWRWNNPLFQFCQLIQCHNTIYRCHVFKFIPHLAAVQCPFIPLLTDQPAVHASLGCKFQHAENISFQVLYIY